MESLDELDASLLKMRDNINKHNVIVAGDFNATDINWETPNASNNCKTSSRILEIVEEHDLTQFVHEPTRRWRETSNILDLVLSNNKNIVSKVTLAPGISDHEIVLLTVRPSCKKKRNVKRKVYCGKRADRARMKEELKVLSDDLLKVYVLSWTHIYHTR